MECQEIDVCVCVCVCVLTKAVVCVILSVGWCI